jgi:hypothetical protein
MPLSSTTLRTAVAAAVGATVGAWFGRSLGAGGSALAAVLGATVGGALGPLWSFVVQRARAAASPPDSAGDIVTGLPDRAQFLARLASERAARMDGTAAPRALLMLGLDRLRVLNDSLGYEVGDQWLREAAGQAAQRASQATTLSLIVMLAVCAASVVGALLFSRSVVRTNANSVAGDPAKPRPGRRKRGCGRQPQAAGAAAG